jgi:hypothetical protein
MSNFRQPIGQYRLRITSAFLPVELTCASIRIQVGQRSVHGHSPDRDRLQPDRQARRDLETVVGDPISPRGTTGVTVDGGRVDRAGVVVLGGKRRGLGTGAPTGIELIPLIHRAVASAGAGASWFVEPAIALDVVAGKITTELDLGFRVAIGL